MRIYVVREVAGGAGFTPRRVVEHLEGARAGPSLVAMYEAADLGGGVTLPPSGVAVGMSTAIRPEDETAPAMAWGAPAWNWLDAKVAAAEAAWAGHPGPRWIWPRVGVGEVPEVLSDVPSVRRFLKDREKDAREGGGWRFVLDPVAMLAATMMDNADEHVKRMLEMLGGHEACGAVVLSDVRPGGAEHAPDAPMARVPIGAGELSRQGLLDWWRRTCPATLPVILGCDRAIPEQIAWLTSG